MARHSFGPAGEVCAAECPRCGGVWLERGELSRVRQAFVLSGLREEATRRWLAEHAAPRLGEMAARGGESARTARRLSQVFSFVCPSWAPHFGRAPAAS
jgi:Zn-finger nucleic acid-binding protein